MFDQSFPTPVTIIRDDFTTEMVGGGPGNDYLIHHRDRCVFTHDGTGIASYAGDDILEGSVPNAGQLHMFGVAGNDWFTLDVTKVAGALGVQGHHAYGGRGQDTYQFTNIDENLLPVIGRLYNFDPTSDRIINEGAEVDLTDLPKSVQLPGGDWIEVRVIEIEHPEIAAEALGRQYFLTIGEDIFYALDGARDLQNGTAGAMGEERHYLDASALDTLRAAPSVEYENPENFVPRDFYEYHVDEPNLNGNPDGPEVRADTGDLDAAHMFGGNCDANDHHSAGQQLMRGSDGDDVIEGNTGNDTIYGGDGNDLIAGGIDNDVIHGATGDDMIWGGDGDDSLNGGKEDDFLDGGRGDDILLGSQGNDTLVGGSGNDTLTGGGGDAAVNRFHFYEEGGNDAITDFKVGLDLITLQDDIDPLTVALDQNDDGNTVLNYGETGSVELIGVSLDDFATAAADRAGAGDPIITMTPDPEEEMLQELHIENGYYSDAVPPDLMVDGLAYGATPFQEPGAGGYTYVSEQDGDDGRENEENDEDHEHDDDGPHTPLSDEEAEAAADDDSEPDHGTCFVATAACGDAAHPDVVFLRAFRDEWLAHRASGRGFVAFYRRVGPKMAGCVRRSPCLASPSKRLIAGIVVGLRKVWMRESHLPCDARSKAR